MMAADLLARIKSGSFYDLSRDEDDEEDIRIPSSRPFQPSYRGSRPWHAVPLDISTTIQSSPSSSPPLCGLKRKASEAFSRPLVSTEPHAKLPQRLQSSSRLLNAGHHVVSTDHATQGTGDNAVIVLDDENDEEIQSKGPRRAVEPAVDRSASPKIPFNATATVQAQTNAQHQANIAIARSLAQDGIQAALGSSNIKGRSAGLAWDEIALPDLPVPTGSSSTESLENDRLTEDSVKRFEVQGLLQKINSPRLQERLVGHSLPKSRPAKPLRWASHTHEAPNATHSQVINDDSHAKRHSKDNTQPDGRSLQPSPASEVALKRARGRPAELAQGQTSNSSSPLSSASNAAIDTPVKPLSLRPILRASRLPSMKGRPFSHAECLLLVYLKEVVGISCSTLDTIMGRTNNCCITRYSRSVTGMKEPAVQEQYQYARVKPLLDKIFATDVSVDFALQTLERHVVNLPQPILPVRVTVTRGIPDHKAPSATTTVKLSNETTSRLIRHSRLLQGDEISDQPVFSFVPATNDQPGSSIEDRSHRDRFSRRRDLRSNILSQECGARPSAIQDNVLSNLRPVAKPFGLAADVWDVAWANNGDDFAAGSIVDDSPRNRPCNLVMGSMQRRTLTEQPYHHTTANGITTFHTVSRVAFSHCSDYLVSVGFDCQARIYRTSGEVGPIWSFDHQVEIDDLAFHRSEEIFVTACKRHERALTLFAISNRDEVHELTAFSSAKALSNSARKVHPSALKWGNFRSNYLLAGFSVITEDNTNFGEVCLWDCAVEKSIPIATNSGSIFDVAWSPHSDIIAFARPVTQAASKHSRTQIDIVVPKECDGRNEILGYKGKGWTFECPAVDINKISFCQYDDRLMAATATDGKVYIWDVRRPDNMLHTFAHGPTKARDQHGEIKTEREDCGIGFMSWGHTLNELYSGSSDGIVSIWDVRRAPEDAHVRNFAKFDAGVVSGAFNSDFTRLILGTADGTATVYEAKATFGREVETLEDFDVQQIKITTEESKSGMGIEGIEESRKLLNSGGLQLVPSEKLPIRQAIQGPRYTGPFNNDNDTPNANREDQASRRRKPIDWSAPQCHLDGCVGSAKHSLAFDSENKDVPVEVSKRWLDRVPHSLQNPLSSNSKLPVGFVRCARCKGAARPGDKGDGERHQESESLCERCKFACLRCDSLAATRVDLRGGSVHCSLCRLTWDIGVLGYNRRQAVEAIKPLAELYSSGDKYRGMDRMKWTNGDEENVVSLLEQDFAALEAV